MDFAVLVLSPLVAAVLALFQRKPRVLGITSMLSSTIALVSAVVIAHKVAESGSYHPFSFVAIDALSALIVMVAAIVCFFAAMYSLPHLTKEASHRIIGTNRIRKYYVQSNLAFAVMLLSVSANYPVMAWIFLEATTLATAFLISFYDKPSTIEAAWKYLILNSTGLVLGFFGALLYFTALPNAAGGFVSWQDLAANAHNLDPTVAKIAFIFVLVGIGTKAGLAPMHTWKPDAYSKSPAPVGAMLSGALLPVALAMILKFKVVTDSALGTAFTGHLLIIFGVISIVIAALSTLTIRNYKRLLAYSSIEHVGIMALGFGFGGLGTFAALLHIIYHSFMKSSLFFLSGNLLTKYHSAKIEKVRGGFSVIPATGILFFVSFLAITGLPPFGIFLTEFLTLSAGAQYYIGAVVVALLAMAVLFIGFFKHTNAMLFSKAPEGTEQGEGSIWLIIPSLALMTLTLVLSLHLPEFVQVLLHNAAADY